MGSHRRAADQQPANGGPDSRGQRGGLPAGRYFGVPVSYLLLDDSDPAAADDLTSQLQLLVVLRDSGAERLALRAHGLSEGSRQVLAAMVEQLRKVEGLAEDDEPALDTRASGQQG